MAAEDDLLAALTGSAVLGDYVDTVDDRLDKALTAAWVLAAGLNLNVPALGGDPGPYRPADNAWDAAYDQVVARYGAAPKARSLAERAQLLEVLVRGIDSKRPAPTPTPPPISTWKRLPVLTSAAATSDTSSFQSAVPSWTFDGMVVSLPAKGDKPGTPNPTSGGSTQRCEIHLAGWGSLTGTLFLRYDFTLAQGFPTATSDWQVVAQLKNSSTGSPPLELGVGNNVVYLVWHDSKGNEVARETLGAAVTGVKHSVVLQVPFTTSSAAPVSGWFDGAAAFTSKNHGPTMYPSQSSYGKLGCYRSNAIGVAATVTHHGVAKGSTFASVTS